MLCRHSLVQVKNFSMYSYKRISPEQESLAFWCPTIPLIFEFLANDDKLEKHRLFLTIPHNDTFSNFVDKIVILFELTIYQLLAQPLTVLLFKGYPFTKRRHFYLLYHATICNLERNVTLTPWLSYVHSFPFSWTCLRCQLGLFQFPRWQV